MESEKNSDLEEKNKQDCIMNMMNKELLDEGKSKIDLSSVLDGPLQGQDFTNGLNAEVDLDDSLDKVDDLNEKNKERNEDVSNRIGENKTQNGEVIGTVNEGNSSSKNKDTVDKGDTGHVETTEDQSSNVESNAETVLENEVVNETVITEGTMGNNLEGKEGTETNIDQNCEENSNDCCLSDNNKSDNEKETNNCENVNDIENCENIGHHETSEAQESSANTEKESTDTRNTEEKLNLETDVDTGLDVSGNGELGEVIIKESSNDKESQENLKENEDNFVREEQTEDVCEMDIKVEDEVRNEDEITDREKIQNFIKEVINDLHGIVMETEKCDSVVNDICEGSTRSELVKEREVTSNEIIPTFEGSEISGSCKATEAVSSEEEMEEGSNNLTSSISECDATESDTACELVIKENTDQAQSIENSFSVVDKMPTLHENANTDDDKTSEIGVENSVGLTNTCNPLKEKSCGNKEHYQSSEEKPNISSLPQTTVPVRRKEKDDIKMVEEELKSVKAALQASQRTLQDERSKHNRDVMQLKLQLYKSQTESKCQKSKSEKQLTDIMSHLVLMEGRLRQEQLRLKRESRAKNITIENQKKEIMKLKDQNEQLLNAIKEICAKGGMNGYMRENRRRNGNYMDGSENSAKGNKDKKGLATGKLGSMKDKFMAKNRSSLELNNFGLEKYLIKDERLCSSQEDLHRLGNERRRSIHTIDERMTKNQRHAICPIDRPISDNSEYKNGNHKTPVKYSQNFFSDTGSPQFEMNKSVSESSHLSESTNSSSGVYSLSDHDLSMHNDSVPNGHHGNSDYLGDDDDDDRIFSFSSTHINTVIAEEETMGPAVSHSGQMMSMGSMPMLANCKEELSGKNRPHSLSSVDLISIQQQAQNLARLEQRTSPNSTPIMEKTTPPSSPSLTPFQTFKTMFRRSKNKGHKKRSVSLSQTTNTEYSEALKKHFQKYDMS